MTTARRHHFLSQFYLGSFLSIEQPAKINVLNIESGKWFQTNTANVAAERDFNRVERKNTPIDALENALGRFESDASVAVKRVVESEEYPDPEDLNWLLNVVALYATRNPRNREAYNDFRERQIRQLGSQLVSDKDLYEKQLRKARAAGYVETDSVPFEEIKRFVESEAYTIEFSLDKNHDVEFRTLDKMLPILGRRQWSLLITKNEVAKFITCDHPVVITPKKPPATPAGIGTKETELVFPLSPRLMLYGVFETPLKNVVDIEPSRVATFNTRIAHNAERQIYSSEPAIVMRRQGKIVRCVPAA